MGSSFQTRSAPPGEERLTKIHDDWARAVEDYETKAEARPQSPGTEGSSMLANIMVPYSYCF